MVRKFVQFQWRDEGVLALCDDGTVWRGIIDWGDDIKWKFLSHGPDQSPMTFHVDKQRAEHAARDHFEAQSMMPPSKSIARAVSFLPKKQEGIDL